MRSDFEPKRLKEANVKLDKQLLNMTEQSEEQKEIDKVLTNRSLWQRILALFK